MDAAAFRKYGHEMVEYIAGLLWQSRVLLSEHRPKSISISPTISTEFLDAEVHKKPVLSKVEPGYLKPLLPSEAPHDPESFESIMEVIDRLSCCRELTSPRTSTASSCPA